MIKSGLSLLLSFALASPAFATSPACPEGQTLNTDLGKCVSKESGQALTLIASDCKGDKECFKRVAEQELKKAEEEDKVDEKVKDLSGLLNTGMKAASIIVPLTVTVKMLATGHSYNKCAKVSMIALVGGSAALLAGTLFAGKGHKKRLEKIRSEWESKNDTQNGQSEAFEMMAKGEDSMAKSASEKATYYTIAFAAFSASAVAAMLELISPDGGMCYAGESSISDPRNFRLKRTALHNLENAVDFKSYLSLKQEYESLDELSFVSPTLDDFQKYSRASNQIVGIDSVWGNVKVVLNEIIPIREANAQAEAVAPVEEIVVVGKRLPFLGKAVVRAALSTVIAGWSAIMMNHAKKQARVSNRRAEFLRKMKSDFVKESGSGSIAIDGSSTGSSSETGIAGTGSSETGAGQNSENSSGFCVTSSNQIDESCACKARQSCSRAIRTPISGRTLGFSTGGPTPDLVSAINQGLVPADSVLTGGAGSANIDVASAQSAAAMRNLATAKSLEGKLPAATKNLLKSERSKIENDLISAASGVNLPSTLALSNPLEQTEALEASLGISRKNLQNASATQPLVPASTFTDDMSISEGAVATVDEKKISPEASEFDYGTAEIVKTEKGLFNIISDRYQKSFRKQLD